MLVGFGDASGGRQRNRHAIPVEWAQLQSSWISQVPSGPTLRIFPSSSCSIQQGPTQLSTEEDQTSSATAPLSKALAREAFSMRAGWMQVLPGAPQTTPRGELWAFILALSHTRHPSIFCRLHGAGHRVSRKAPSFPVQASGEILESNWSTRDQKRLQGGSTSCGQPCHC